MDFNQFVASLVRFVTSPLRHQSVPRKDRKPHKPSARVRMLAGSRLGGINRAKNLSPERRREIALKAYAAFLQATTPEQRDTWFKNASRLGGLSRWNSMSPEEKKAHMERMHRAASAKMSPEDRSRVAGIASRARWEKWRKAKNQG